MAASATFLLLTASGCKTIKEKNAKNIMPGTWQATPITIDGSNLDWPSPYPNYDSKAKIGYATANNESYLYITMETGDEMTQMKILKMGMIVSIDTGGGKNISFSINYPLPNTNSELDLTSLEKGSKESPGGSARTLAKNIKTAKEQATQLSLEGFPQCHGGFVVGQNNECGIQVRSSIDKFNDYVWEAAIPFKAIFGKAQLTDAEYGKAISVCYEVKGMKAPKENTDNANQSMGNNMGGRSSMGNAGINSRMGGGGGSVRNRQPESPWAHMYLTTKTWKQFKLTKI